MARQYKCQVVYPTPPTAELYWHDNGTIEFVTIPQQVASDMIGIRADLLEQIINFMKSQLVTRIEITRVP
jgi:hypothetical protein